MKTWRVAGLFLGTKCLEFFGFLGLQFGSSKVPAAPERQLHCTKNCHSSPWIARAPAGTRVPPVDLTCQQGRVVFFSHFGTLDMYNIVQYVMYVLVG